MYDVEVNATDTRFISIHNTSNYGISDERSNVITLNDQTIKSTNDVLS